MNETINTIKNHRSIRTFENKAINEETVDQIFEATTQSSTFSMLQAVTVIRITDKQTRKKVMELSGDQTYINEASEFWIFCSDFNRNHTIEPDTDIAGIDLLEIGAVDVGIMAQNALTAAESLGLGGVYIGGVRLNIEELTSLLNLPKYVIPVIGLCIGYPDKQVTQTKPRLPKSILFHENEYQPFSTSDLEQYDKDMLSYYKNRPDTMPKKGKKVKTWSQHIKDTLWMVKLNNSYSYLKKQGYIE